MLTISIKPPLDEKGVQSMPDERLELIRRACLKVNDDLGNLGRYVPEYQVTFQRISGDYNPVITAIISRNGDVKFRYTRGNITEPEKEMIFPREEEIVGYFIDLDERILDHVDISELVWDQLRDCWYRFKDECARLMGT